MAKCMICITFVLIELLLSWDLGPPLADWIHDSYQWLDVYQKACLAPDCQHCEHPVENHIYNSILMITPAPTHYLQLWQWRGWTGLPVVLTSTPSNACGISLDTLFVSESPTKDDWLVCSKCFLKNWMSSFCWCVTKLGCSMRRMCEDDVTVYYPSTYY